MEFFFLIVFAILGFAFYGFICFCIWLTKSNSHKEDVQQISRPSTPRELDDVRATERLLEHLFLTERIDEDQYATIREVLENDYEKSLQRKRIVKTEFDDPEEQTAFDAENSLASEPVVVVGSVSPSQSEADPSFAPTELEVTNVHPLDRPDEPEPEDVPPAPAIPRRSFGEMLAGFMEKRNIRWGELASGLLIVGSAVGLVISLREELRDRIPYFSALVFMLITAAIHGAGTYTLKRWKLRNTSRGVLLIGMLLVPLNFLAACLLNGSPEQRRSLSDPLFWVAVTTGVVAYSAMSWFSTRNLFRIRHLGVAVAVVVCGISILIANRLDGISNSIFATWTLAASSFLAWHLSVLYSAPRIWKRSYASSRFRDRLLTVAGIGLFSLLAFVSMLLIRSEHRVQTLLTLTPLIASVGIAIICIGDRLSGNLDLTKQLLNQEVTQSTTTLIARSVNLCGWLTLLGAFVGSMFHPVVVLAASATVICMSISIRTRRRVTGLLTAACVALAGIVLVGVAVLSRRMEAFDWSTLSELAEAVSHGQTGVALMISGALALLGGMVWKRSGGATETVADSSMASWFPTRLRRFSIVQVFAGSALALGLSWLILASLLHRGDWWDVNLGSATAVFAALGGLVLIASRKSPELVHSCVFVILVLAGAHLLQWNIFFCEWFLDQSWMKTASSGFDARVMTFSAVAALAVSVASYFGKQFSESKRIDPLSVSCWLFVGVTIGSAIFVSRHQSSLTLVCLFAAGIATGFLLTAKRNLAKVSLFANQVEQVLMSLVLVGLVANVVVRFGVTTSLGEPKHLMLQTGTLSILLVVGHRAASMIKWGEWKWLLQILTTAFLTWFTIGLSNLCLVELVADYSGESFRWLDFKGHAMPLVVTGITVVASQMLVASRSTNVVEGVLYGFSLVAIVTAFAVQLETSQAVATGCRWLVPLGVGGVAILIGCRELIPSGIRKHLLISARRSRQQNIINTLLVVAVVVVLGISTVAIARSLVVGAGALGGPLQGTWFGNLRKDISYGGPVGLIVATFLWFAITERRSFLAMAGSGVFQYVVLLAIVLLFVSPHPKLASTWFINIMQAISLGMTGYGMIWLWQRARIGDEKIRLSKSRPPARWRMLDAHAIINVLLVLSMVVLIFQRYFFYPTVSGDWITSAGSPLGISTAIVVTVFVIFLWRGQLGNLFDLVLMFGCLAVVAFAAAAVDRTLSNGNGFIPWSSYRTLAGGSLLTVGILIAKTLVQRPSDGAGLFSLRASLPESQAYYSRIAIGIAIGVSFLFCVFGTDADPGGSWLYLVGSGFLIFAMACHAYFFRSSFVGFAVLPMAWIFASQVTLKLGAHLHGGSGPNGTDLFLVHIGASGLVAAIWVAIDWVSIRLKKAQMKGRFFLMPNVVTLLGGILSFGMATLAILVATESVRYQASSFHVLAVFGTGCAWLLSFWSRKGHFQIFAGLLTVGVCFTLAMCLLPDSVLSEITMRVALMMLAWALTLFAAANVWARCGMLKKHALKFKVLRVNELESAIASRLPLWIYFVGGLVFVVAASIVWNDSWKATRITASFATLMVAASLIAFSLRKPKYPIQLTSILATVASFMLISISGEGVVDSASGLVVFFRGLLVPAVSVFLFGVFATRWLRSGDSWITPIRNATAVLTAVTLLGSQFFLLAQFNEFDSELGSGIGVSRAVTLLVVLMAMIAGLLMIAVVPKRDPFSLSLKGRKGYVYAAQVVCVMAGAHVYLSMPWLLKTGILQYWPYIAIAVSLLGVLLSELLKRRSLDVLSEPIFNTAALVPVLASIGYWLIDSKADAALTFLLSGLIYLAIAIRYRAVWSGVMAMVLGNLALWIFYSQRSIEFSSHPQLWLIPPAVCVLLATYLERRWFTAKQLTAIRYACMFVIYLSSTSEIVINGIGQLIWPPLVLAVLSIAGMAAGIMLQIRSFLFVGAAFLFVAVIAMVSHAQQTLDHVWPWWAFGILAGSGILVVFGLFEKRRNDLIQLGKQMRNWEG